MVIKKISFQTVFFLFCLVALAIIFILIVVQPTSPNTVEKNIVDTSYSGIITKIYRDSTDHNQIKMVIGKWETQPIPFKLYSHIEKGDSIYKKMNRPVIEVHKLNGEFLIFDLNKNEIR